ncbi:IS3 family transposase [Streptococcus equi subsp. equi]|nr:IS3 family transposase [Streptococcus equi subsp. equi]
MKSLILSRSTYYYQVKQLAQEDKDMDLKELIQGIYDEHHGNYGYRRIHLELRNRGFIVNHKKVQRLMTVMGLKARSVVSASISSTKVRLAKRLII